MSFFEKISQNNICTRRISEPIVRSFSFLLASLNRLKYFALSNWVMGEKRERASEECRRAATHSSATEFFYRKNKNEQNFIIRAEKKRRHLIYFPFRRCNTRHNRQNTEENAREREKKSKMRRRLPSYVLLCCKCRVKRFINFMTACVWTEREGEKRVDGSIHSDR